MCWNLPKQTKQKKLKSIGPLCQSCTLKRIFKVWCASQIAHLSVISSNSFKLLLLMERVFQG